MGDIMGRLLLYASAVQVNAPLNGGGLQVLAEAAEEIERLRAKAARADELQALIDAYNETWEAYLRSPSSDDRWMDTVDARDALFAAAARTEEDDRG